MKKLILAGAAALAFAVPAVAQDMAVTASGDVYVRTADQETTFRGWPADRQSTYTAWPNTYQSYYWTLTPSQQEGWWVLTDEQRAQVYAMAPEQRTAAWTSIERQIASRPSANASMTAQTATTAAMTASTAGPGSVSTGVSATTPSTTNYPLCSATVTDSCINPREAGRNYGNRPLKHWPGRPASEMKGAKTR
jgi:hypothetical protein